MGLLTNGITSLLMKTIFRGTAERIDNMIDSKGKAEVIKASNEFKETVVKLRKTLDDPKVRKELEQAGVKSGDFPWYSDEINLNLYNEDGTLKGKLNE